jgi:hypothetical protein
MHPTARKRFTRDDLDVRIKGIVCDLGWVALLAAQSPGDRCGGPDDMTCQVAATRLVDVPLGKRYGHTGYRVAAMVANHRCHRGKVFGDLAVLGGVSTPADLDEQLAEGGQGSWPAIVSKHEQARIREQSGHLLTGQGGQHRSTARGELSRQSDSDIGHQWLPTRCPLLDDVDDLATMQDGQMRVLPCPVDECGERDPGKPGQRLLAAVPSAEFVGGNPERVSPILWDVKVKALVQ